MAPARVIPASAPWLFGLCLDHGSANNLWRSASPGLAAFVTLLLLPAVAGTTRALASDRSDDSGRHKGILVFRCLSTGSVALHEAMGFR
jgi:hypothetical protein